MPISSCKEFIAWDIPDPKDFEPDEFIEVSKQIESNVKSLTNNITKNL
jgi:protein-tyrosine-phosphatase